MWNDGGSSCDESGMMEDHPVRSVEYMKDHPVRSVEYMKDHPVRSVDCMVNFM